MSLRTRHNFAHVTEIKFASNSNYDGKSPVKRVSRSSVWGIKHSRKNDLKPWWRHQMETFSALLALVVGNSPVTGEFPSQRPVTRGSDSFFDLRLNKRLSKQSWGWWFETPTRSLWRHCNAFSMLRNVVRADRATYSRPTDSGTCTAFDTSLNLITLRARGFKRINL